MATFAMDAVTGGIPIDRSLVFVLIVIAWWLLGSGLACLRTFADGVCSR